MYQILCYFISFPPYNKPTKKVFLFFIDNEYKDEFKKLKSSKKGYSSRSNFFLSIRNNRIFRGANEHILSTVLPLIWLNS